MALELVRGYVPLVVLTAQSSILVSLLHHVRKIFHSRLPPTRLCQLMLSLPRVAQSRVHTGRTYSAPGAVLLVELIKGFVALGVVGPLSFLQPSKEVLIGGGFFF